ncbi:MAG: CBS domain-containing protein, partial [Chloroflexi bacterium]|nr:CBS domain-containing protein [Chloroflexota bacterium]
MLVKQRMSRHPITVRPKTSLHDALRVMRDNKVRRLPVLDEKNRLVGIVSEKQLLYASPSPATSLSIYEMNYLMSKVTVDELMTREVVTVPEDCPLEEAARIMEDNDVSGLPVMRGDLLVGMITESDLFKVFTELLGARTWGLRVTIRVREGHGVLAKLTQQLSDRGADFVALGTFWGDDVSNREIAFKVQGIDRGAVEAIIADLDA